VPDDAAAADPVPGLDMTVSHSARIWNYWLGGTDNYPADRQAGDKVAAMVSGFRAMASPRWGMRAGAWLRVRRAGLG